MDIFWLRFSAIFWLKRLTEVFATKKNITWMDCKIFMVTLPCQETHFNALMLSMEFVRKLTGLKYENFVLLIGSIPSTVVLTVFNKRIAKGSLYNLKIVIDICLAGHSSHLSRHHANGACDKMVQFAQALNYCMLCRVRQRIALKK